MLSLLLATSSILMTIIQEPDAPEPPSKDTAEKMEPSDEQLSQERLEERIKKQLEELLKKRLEDSGPRITPPLRVGPPPWKLDLPSLLLKPTKMGAPTETRRFDIDGDGVDDLSLQRTDGQGPLSTTSAHYELIVLGETRILRGGAPVALGGEITITDLLSAGLGAHLCSVGASPWFLERSFEDLSGGPWWGKERHGLAMATVRNGRLRMGFVLMSVSKQGDVEVHSTHLEEIALPSIRVAASR